MASLLELNLDGLVGPTHNYAGLSRGNLASSANGGRESSPKRAALEGLSKMRMLADLGVPQLVMPPQERPHVGALRQLGFEGSDAQVVEAAARDHPLALATCTSGSAMWTANAATVAPSADTRDGRVHFSVANLVAKPHRAIEAAGTFAGLRAIFPDRARFVVHTPVPGGAAFGDEGAANHTRLVSRTRGGLHLFVYGREALCAGEVEPTRFASRQTLEASRAVARRHRLHGQRTLFVQQSPAAIEAGVFHNDVIAVGHQDGLFVHERAFVDTAAVLVELQEAVPELRVMLVCERDVPLSDVVRSYLFNSQIVTSPYAERPVMIAPEQCREVPSAVDAIAGWRDIGAIGETRFVDLAQSMNNGGGPACLRLRVPLSRDELTRVHRPCLLDAALHSRLERWVDRHYRDRLGSDDLADPSLLFECRAALDELTQILELGSFYAFQRPPIERRRPHLSRAAS